MRNEHLGHGIWRTNEIWNMEKNTEKHGKLEMLTVGLEYCKKTENHGK
jgi:hypothetical protein